MVMSADHIRARILENSECKSIRNLLVTFKENVIILTGIARSFVSKQKAQVVVQKALFDAKEEQFHLLNEIQVDYDLQI